MSTENSFIPPEAIESNNLEVKASTLYVSPEYLYEENNSERARARVDTWNESRRTAKLVAQKRCSDARTVLIEATTAVDLRAIACGGDNETYDAVLNSPGVALTGNITHFDAEAMNEFIDDPAIKELPEDALCGGQQGAKNGVTGEIGIGRYIEQDIAHFDPTIQAVIVASNASKLTDKIVFAAAQDHLTGTTHPLAWFANQGRSSASAIPQADIFEMLYNPEKFDARRLYDNGFPCLEDHEMPERLAEFFEKNKMQVKEMADKYPDLNKRKKIQDPGMIILTTDIRPVVVRYPGLESPGSFFELRVPRSKINGVDLQIDVNELERVLNQAEYPISHATQHHGQKEKSFANTRQLLIETRDINKSRHLADTIAQKLWMQDWMNIEGTQVLTAQTVSGELQDVDYYTPNL